MSADPMGNNVSSQLQARNDLSELPRLSEFLANFFARTGLPVDLAGDFELALEEVFANVVMHAHPNGGQHEISMSIALEGVVVKLTVEDDGVPFNPLEAPLVDLDLPLEKRGTGGLGIHLIKGLMDELEYNRAEARNRLVMRKKIRI
jgi:anti-sigma regulatory factor (Ser/Thr protein kinase)